MAPAFGSYFPQRHVKRFDRVRSVDDFAGFFGKIETELLVASFSARLPFVGDYRTFLIGQQIATVGLMDQVSGFAGGA